MVYKIFNKETKPMILKIRILVDNSNFKYIKSKQFMDNQKYTQIRIISKAKNHIKAIFKGNKQIFRLGDNS